MKVRARNMRKSQDVEMEHPATSGVESGRDSGKEIKRRRGSRQNSKDKEKKPTPTSSIKNGRDRHVLGPPVSIRPKNNQQHSLLWRRSAGRELPLPPIALGSAPMARSSSAPTSPALPPVDAAVSPGMTTIVGSIDDPRHGDAEFLTKPKRSFTENRPINTPRRQLTAPTFPRFLKRSDQDVHTDTEMNGSTLPRAKQREKMGGQAPGGSLPAPAPSSVEDGSSTPNRPRARRLQTALMLNLPDHLQQHLAAQWPGGRPHAGSWQDAYYGYYAENPTAAKGSKDNLNGEKLPSRKGSDTRDNSSLASRRPSRIQEINGTPEDSGAGSLPASPVRRRSTRKKPRRYRRYRHAMAPPTPSGLGFTPNETRKDGENWKEGRLSAGENGFDWGNQNGITPRTGMTGFTDGVDRDDGQAIHEKTGAATDQTSGPWWRFGRKRKPMLSNGRVEKISWRKKLRRMIFLDARVTIYVRLINLVVVIVSLGESYLHTTS